jgi:hypothetical protein
MTERAEYMKEYHKQYRLNNMDKIKENKKVYVERKRAIAEIKKIEADSSEEETKPINKAEYRKMYYEANKERLKQLQRERYEKDEEYKEHKKELMRNNRKCKYADPVLKIQLCEKVKDVYKNNEDYRNKVREQSKNKYHNDDEYREKYLQQRRFNTLISKITS